MTSPEYSPQVDTDSVKISVALCTFNGARFIAAQLESISLQTRLPDELIVCDDCSTDETLSLVKDFSTKAPFNVLYFKNEIQLGVTKNFELAISKCTGDIIFLSDQDDYWLPEKLFRIACPLAQDERVGLVFSNATVTDSVLNPLGYTMWETVGLNTRRRRQLNSDKALSVLLRRCVVTGATLAFRSKLRTAIMPIPPRCFHDAWIACVVAAQSRIVVIDKPLIMYRQHDANVIGGKQKTYFLKVVEALNAPFRILDIEISRSVDLMTRLHIIDGNHFDKKYFDELSKKILHLRNRREMYFRNRFARLPLVVREFFSGRYFMFSEGLGAVFLDIFVRKKRDRLL